MSTSVLIVDDHPSFRAQRAADARGGRLLGGRRGRGRRGGDRRRRRARPRPGPARRAAARPRRLRGRRRGSRGRGGALRRSSSPPAASAPTSARRSPSSPARGFIAKGELSGETLSRSWLARSMQPAPRPAGARGARLPRSALGSAALILTSDHTEPARAGGGADPDRRLGLRRHRPLRLGPPARQQHRAADDGGRLHLVLPGRCRSSNDSVVFAIGVHRQLAPLRDPRPPAGQLPRPAACESRFQRIARRRRLLRRRPSCSSLWALFIDPTEQSDCEGCPENPILIAGHEGIAEAINAFQVADRRSSLIAATVVIVYPPLAPQLAGAAPRPQPRRRSPAASPSSILLAQLVLGQLGVLRQAVKTVAYVAAIASSPASPSPSCSACCARGSAATRRSRTALTAENEQLNAELQAKVEELRASRARIVEAGYARAAPGRARPPRRRPAAAGRADDEPAAGPRQARGRPGGAGELLDEAMEELDRGDRRSCASWPAASTRPCSATAASRRRSSGLADRSPVPVEIVETPGRAAAGAGRVGDLLRRSPRR